VRKDWPYSLAEITDIERGQLPVAEYDLDLDRVTAYFAVLDQFLPLNSGIEQYGDVLPTIRALIKIRFHDQRI